MSALFSRLARLFRLECQKRQALLAELSAIRTDGFSFTLPPSIFNDGIPNLHHFQTIREYSPYPVQNCLGMAVFTPEQRQLGRELLQQLQGLVTGRFHVVAATEKAATKLVAIVGDNGMPYFITRNVTPYYDSELIFLAKSHTSCIGSDDVGQLLTSLGWADAGAWLKHLSSQTD